MTDWPRLLKRALLFILFAGLGIELLWILRTNPDKRDPVAEAAASSTTVRPGNAPTTTIDPNAVVLGVLVNSPADTPVESGIRFGLADAKKANVAIAEKVRIQRCVVAPGVNPEDCATNFRNANVQAIVANPEVDPTAVLDSLTADLIPYVGAYPTRPSEFIDPNSYQLAPGDRGTLLAPLRWAIDVKAPSVVLISTDATRAQRDVFVAAAAKLKMPVQSFTFEDVGTNVNPFLKPVGGKKPIVFFLAENSGCDVVLRGLERRRAGLAGGMQATFVSNACSESAVKAKLDGLRLMAARSFANETLSDTRSLAEASGRATTTALMKTLPASAWEEGSSSVRTALGAATQANPFETLGAWNCANRRLADALALCGQQTQVVGLGTDTTGLSVWVDSLQGP